MTHRCEADFIMLLGMLAKAFPRAPVIGVICDNDSSCHTRAVTSYLEKHPRLEGLYGARYSPHDNPAERIWAALKSYVASTAVSWPGRLRQIHALLPQPLTRPDAGHRRALDQPLAATRLRVSAAATSVSTATGATGQFFFLFRRRPGPGSSHPGQVTARMCQVETRVSHRADQHPMMLRVIAHCLLGRCRRE